MRPTVTRRPLTLAAVASLLLCIATLALWVRSYGAADRLECFDKVGSVTLGSRNGAIGFWRDPEWSGTARKICYSKVESDWPFGGAMTFRAHVRYGRQLRIIFPHWFLALFSAILPALYLRVPMRLRHDGRTGRCSGCGYDLRATPERCPECGHTPVRAVGCVPP